MVLSLIIVFITGSRQILWLVGWSVGLWFGQVQLVNVKFFLLNLSSVFLSLSLLSVVFVFVDDFYFLFFYF